MDLSDTYLKIVENLRGRNSQRESNSHFPPQYFNPISHLRSKAHSVVLCLFLVFIHGLHSRVFMTLMTLSICVTIIVPFSV